MCAHFLTDALIHLEKQTMTVQRKVTVNIFLIQVQPNGPLSFFSSFVCVYVYPGGCTLLHDCSHAALFTIPCMFTILSGADVLSADSLLQQVFAVRFLGSMAVRCGDNQEVIYEAMRQVLAARAIHNIFRTTESHLMVTSSSLRYEYLL